VYVDLSEAEEALILATIDPLSAMAVTDKDLLANLVGELEVSDEAIKAMLAELAGEQVNSGLTDPDACPPVPVAPSSRLGDLWLLGEHRVLCGDSTDADSVSRLLSPTSGLRAPFLMVTDPPYGVEYDPTWRDGKGGFSTAPVLQRGKVANDDRADWTLAYLLFPGSVAYIWHASLKTVEVAVSVESAGFQVRSVIIWRKQQPLFSQGHYHWQHEPCWYAVRKGHSAHWHGDRKQSTVWDVQNLNPTGNRMEERLGHAAQKPVELMRRPILNHTGKGEVVYDPFLGSGTTVIAADGSERICYGLEIDPLYVDVIVKRWQDLTGKQATLEGHDGLTFEHVRHGRLLAYQDVLKEQAVEACH
jgi:DNA modification methylase